MVSLRLLQGRERVLSIAFFIGGFLFDVATVGRIDSWLTIAQQAAYLAVATGILVHALVDEGGGGNRALTPVSKAYFRWRMPAVHFVLGALLSLYTIFFFKSSSLLVSFGFLAVLAVLLVANESSRLKSLGPAFRFALLALCFLSFAAVLVPVLAGRVGPGVFLASMLAGCLPLAAVAAGIGWRVPAAFPRVRREVLTPLGSVLLVFLLFYLFRLIPPVPLSIPFIGVYHGVERTDEGFVLTHERPAWRFWHHGDQWFRAQGGDRIHVYFRVFSPARFSDEVLMRWFLKDEARGWTLQDTIPIRIVGGREQGFRGFGVKSNYPFGKWKVQVETTDGREIGRIYFDVDIAPEAPRTLAAELD